MYIHFGRVVTWGQNYTYINGNWKFDCSQQLIGMTDAGIFELKSAGIKVMHVVDWDSIPAQK